MTSEFKPIISELSNQGWHLETNSNGHYKATPPDPTKKLIHFSDSNDPRAVHNALRDLRASGFVWPAPSKKELRAQNRIEAEANQEPDNEPKEPKDMDTLWLELKDAKVYLTLANESLSESKQKFEEAKRAFKEAESERDRAAQNLKAKKAEFDSAFDITAAA